MDLRNVVLKYFLLIIALDFEKFTYKLIQHVGIANKLENYVYTGLVPSRPRGILFLRLKQMRKMFA
jgi:hypothetical protein